MQKYGKANFNENIYVHLTKHLGVNWISARLEGGRCFQPSDMSSETLSRDCIGPIDFLPHKLIYKTTRPHIWDFDETPFNSGFITAPYEMLNMHFDLAAPCWQFRRSSRRRLKPLNVWYSFKHIHFCCQLYQLLVYLRERGVLVSFRFFLAVIMKIGNYWTEASNIPLGPLIAWNWC